MGERRVVVRRGRHFGWWVDGRKESGSRFMLTWWPTEQMANAVARWVGRRVGGLVVWAALRVTTNAKNGLEAPYPPLIAALASWTALPGHPTEDTNFGADVHCERKTVTAERALIPFPGPSLLGFISRMGCTRSG